MGKIIVVTVLLHFVFAVIGVQLFKVVDPVMFDSL